MADTSLVFNILAKDKASKVFDKLKGTAATAGVAIGAALAVGTAEALNRSKLNGVLAAQLGASPAEAAALGKLSGEVYAAGFGEDMPAVSNAIRSAAQNGLVDMANAGDAASKATIERLMTVSQVVGDETDRVSAAVSTMLRTGMAGSAEEAMDLIVKATQSGVNKSGDLLDTMEEYGTLFRSLGIDGPQSMGLLSQAIQGGARNADQAADALKELGIRAIDGSKGAAEAYDILGLNAEQMIAKIAKGGPDAAAGMDTILDRLRSIKDPVAQNAAGVGLLGTKWEDMRDAVLSMDLTTATDQMDGLTGATDAAGNAIQETAGQKLERFKRAAMDALVTTLEKAAPHIEKTFGWLSKNSGWVTPLATGLGIFAAAIYGIVTAMKIWSAVQMVLNLSLWTSPITWIVMGVLLLVAAIVLIATKTTWFQTAWEAVWGAIKAYYSFVLNAIVTVFKTWWAVFSGFWKGVGSFFVKVWNGITSKARAAGSWIVDKWNSVLGFFKGVPGKIRNIASGMWDGIKNSFRSAINWIIGKWNGLSFSLPGVSIPGLGQVGGFTLSTPDIPMLADGGIVPATPGGRLAVIGEGGKDEAVVPLPNGMRGLGGPTVIELHSDGTSAGDALIELFRRAIKVRGGDVQVVLGTGRR